MVCRTLGDVVESEEGRQAEEEFDSWNRDPPHRVGNVRAPAESALEHDGSHHIRLHAHGCRCHEDRRDCICVAG